MSATSTQEVWFLTGSQELYGQETLNKVAEHSREIAAHFDAQDAAGARGVEAHAQGAGCDLADVPRGQRGARLRRRDHLDAHVLAREDVGARPQRSWQSRWRTCTRSSTASCPGRRSTWSS